MDNIIIAIYDKQKMAAQTLKSLLESVQDLYGKEGAIKLFTEDKDLLNQIMIVNLIFLNIEDIEIGKKIMRINPDCKIIVIAEDNEHMKKAFHINAIRFITKPFCAEEIIEALDAAFCSKIGNEVISLYYQRTIFEIKHRDIRYVQACNGYSEFFVGNKVFRKETSLRELEKIFDKRLFCRIHRQYIINLRWIIEYNNEKIKIGDKIFGISRRNQKEFEQRNIKYNLEYW